MKASLFFALLASGSLALGAATPAPETETVTIIVTSLASPQSVVKLNFYNAPEKFLKSGQYALQLAVKPGGKTEIKVPVELTTGEWAVALSQDTNNNDKLDKNFLGIPTEPYAFSNNVRPHLAAPGFEECKFIVSGPGKVVTIALKD